MQFLRESQSQESNTVTIYQEGEKLTYHIGKLVSNQNLNDQFFWLINTYLEGISLERKRTLFHILKELKRLQAEDPGAINRQGYFQYLENKVREFTEALNYSEFIVFVRWNERHINLPEDIKEEFVPDPNLLIIKEKTYIKSEYVGLIGLSLFFRACLPIYVDYFNHISSTVKFHHYRTFSLFFNTVLTECDEYVKLYEYIRRNQETLESKSKTDNMIFVEAISSDDIVPNILSSIFFTKLLVTDFITKKSNLVSFIFQTIRMANSFASPLKETVKGKPKKPSGGSGSDRIERSYFEDYRKTSDITLGTIVELQLALDDIESILIRMNVSGFDYDKYQHDLDRFGPVLMNRVPSKVQIILLSLVFQSYINPRALFYIDKPKLTQLFILAKNILWNKDHKFMAAFLMASEKQDYEYIQTHVLRVNHKAILSDCKNNFSFAIDSKTQEAIEKTLTEILNTILNSNWTPMCTDQELLELKTRIDVLTVPSDFQSRFTNFLLYVLS